MPNRGRNRRMGRMALEPDKSEPIKAVQIKITGIVQGVGFRPFIYNLALDHDLKGFVSNTSDGVYIEVEGPPESVRAFEKAIPDEKPPLAQITSIEAAEQPVQSYSDFEIRKSETKERAQ